MLRGGGHYIYFGLGEMASGRVLFGTIQYVCNCLQHETISNETNFRMKSSPTLSTFRNFQRFERCQSTVQSDHKADPYLVEFSWETGDVFFSRGIVALNSEQSLRPYFETAAFCKRTQMLLFKLKKLVASHAIIFNGNVLVRFPRHVFLFFFRTLLLICLTFSGVQYKTRKMN